MGTFDISYTLDMESQCLLTFLANKLMIQPDSSRGFSFPIDLAVPEFVISGLFISHPSS